MTRYTYAGTPADFTSGVGGVLTPDQRVYVWTAASGGTQVSDLVALIGTLNSDGTLTSSDSGLYGFSGPEVGTGAPGDLWASQGTGGVRCRLVGPLTSELLAYVAAHVGSGGGAVASVNGHTGAVVLAASDVGAEPAGTAAAAIAAVVGAAPAALDTLAEIATQLASDESAAGALTTAVAAKYTKPAGGITSSDLAVPSVAAAVAADSALTGAYESVLIYASGAYPARPSSAVSVHWIGPVMPTGWVTNDSWTDNS